MAAPARCAARMILALFALMVLVALPLLPASSPRPMRRPRRRRRGAPPYDASPMRGSLRKKPPRGRGRCRSFSGKRLTLSEVKTIRCTPKGGVRASLANADRCERVTMLEDALARSIRDNIACAPLLRPRSP